MKIISKLAQKKKAAETLILKIVTTEVGGNGLALHHGVGVSTETESKGKDLAVA